MSIDRSIKEPVRGFEPDIARGGAGGGTDIMRFEISLVDPDNRTAYVIPLSRPRPGSVNLEGVELEYLVKVCDPAGCLFNEPEANLLGRQGYAAYVYEDEFSQCSDAGYGAGGYHWEVIQLCCRENVCPEV